MGESRASEGGRTGRLRACLDRCFGIDLRTLALVRICTGALVLADVALRARHLDLFYTDAGLVPRAIVDPAPPLLALFSFGGGTYEQGALFALLGCASIAFALGAWSRFSAIACFLLHGSLLARNPLIIDGQDWLLLQLLIWCMLLPIEARWSLDAHRTDRPLGPSTSRVCSVASAGLTMQFVLLYVTAGLTKTSPGWVDGTVLELSLATEAWTRPLGQWLHGFPQLLRPASHALRAFESFGPLLIFVPRWTGGVRLLVAAAFVTFQALLAACIELRLFPFVSITCTLVLVPGSAWDWLARETGLDTFASRHSPTASPQQPGRSGLAREAVAALLLICAVTLSAHVVGQYRHIAFLERLEPIERAALQIGLYQRWNMYAPGAPRYEQVHELRGLTLAGKTVAMLDRTEPEPWRRVAAAHDSDRLHAYLDSMTAPTVGPSESRAREQAYGAWACRMWNESVREDERVSVVWRSVTTIDRGASPRRRTRRVPGERIVCRQATPTESDTP